ncbi:arylsulfatase [Flavobacterium sp. NG2]|uniref:sulfatase family protein n=1 Tax=Flavobacterium sp. NG2 TaxID=3097547 RepID=UPI002A8041B2|nr:arylsulfatase [Flavobacterium sp. NG2]WPR73169.1 arylsulfatase [Flavobacterium sp. NG2]
MNIYLKSLYCFLLVTCVGASKMHAQNTPNIIFIFADDMGIGDISSNNGKASTPNLDRLVKEGMQFKDAHTSSSVCTPSRYSVLTGRYNWRTRLANHVFSTPTEAPLIKKDEVTVASFLKDAGYHTACIGKWHLGIGWQSITDYKNKEGQVGNGWNIDYSKPAITPTSNGFDYFFGITASLDMPPYVYIENEYATNIPTVTKAFPRKGAATTDFEAVDCLRDFAEKSVAYIDERAQKDKPFFLYLPLTSPHTPIVPSEKFQGKSSIGNYGDFLMETDWVVGEVLKALDKHGLNENTLVIFSTDNGCSPSAKIPNLIEKGHFPNGNLRGHKADIYEGGHRVPFIVRWPSVVKAGTQTDRLTCLTDFISTCSEIIGRPLDEASGVDGVSFLPTLKDPSIHDREVIVHHSINGSFAIRKGDWKLALCPGSGGWSYPRAGKTPAGMPAVQLFNLSTDLEEQHNLQAKYPEKVKELTKLLQSYVDAGRSTPGKSQQNDRDINIYAEDIAK